MNLNSINYESVDDNYDPGYFSSHEDVGMQNEQDIQFDEELNKAMLLSVYSALDEFDKSNGGMMVNPYQDKLSLETSNGTTMEIPIDVQKAAIIQWQNLKNKNKNDMNDVKESSVDMIDSLFQFLFCILIIFTLMYTISLFRKGVIKF